MTTTEARDIFVGESEMARIMRDYDWSSTPLGPPDDWPQSLRSAVSILLSSKAEIVLFWGPDLVALYNDAYAPTFGDKHPWALGKPARECWSEVWDVLGPLFENVLRTGEAFSANSYPFLLRRHGFLEETYYDVSYDPVRAEGGAIGGVFCIVAEKTGEVIGERRLRLLRDIAAESANFHTPDQACMAAASVLAANTADVPFALLYEIEGSEARLAAATGIEQGTAASPRVFDLDGSDAWPIRDVVATGRASYTSAADLSFSGLPEAPWGEPLAQVALLPLATPGQGAPLWGVLVAGISPRRPLDTDYRSFLDLVASQIGASITSAKAYQQERQRAEALAELDKAKTAFFSNVSHEFRTPLTLMLGPLEELIASGSLHKQDQANVETAYRNSLRLLRLVNSLLDFSRIEAGRIDASYELTDIAALTRDLASVFRSAIERAGLQYEVDCETTAQEVYVDREMWEKIVLNLLSNALKFTFEGKIQVRLRDAGDAVELAVIDTGAGIPASELPHIFERFHRVRDARSRTFEGTGIGLSLVADLSRLLRGEVSVQSEPGRGSTFLVRIPTGKAHLPADRIGARKSLTSTATNAAPYVEEGARWLGLDNDTTHLQVTEPVTTPSHKGAATKESGGATVLVVDDNADMRDYIRHLLDDEWRVVTAKDGNAAIELLQTEQIDIVLSDIMMPGLDGFGLLATLRADPETATTPVILLSARAGEESQVEGLEAGADDYLAKPFSARELRARVRTHLALANARREREESLQAVAALKDQFLSLVSHEMRTPLATIYGTSRLLRDRIGLISSADRDELLVDVVNESAKLNRIIENLLLMTRVNAEGLALEPVAVEELVGTAAETFHGRYRDRTLHAEIDSPLAPVEGNATYIELVLDNLLSNAAKYSSPEAPIELVAINSDNSVEVRVLDRGIGLAEEEIDNLFVPFYRSAAAAQTASGVGVGLTVCKRVIEAQGGTIWARPREGGGSEFGFSLPQTSSRAPNQGG